MGSVIFPLGFLSHRLWCLNWGSKDFPKNFTFSYSWISPVMFMSSEGFRESVDGERQFVNYSFFFPSVLFIFTESVHKLNFISGELSSIISFWLKECILTGSFSCWLDLYLNYCIPQTMGYAFPKGLTFESMNRAAHRWKWNNSFLLCRRIKISKL